MIYVCKNCGVSAEHSSSLCNPAREKLDSNLCGASALRVCEEKICSMKYSCDACGSVSAHAEHLCSPREIR